MLQIHAASEALAPVVDLNERLFAFAAVVGGFRHACIITAAPGFGGFGS